MKTRTNRILNVTYILAFFTGPMLVSAQEPKPAEHDVVIQRRFSVGVTNPVDPMPLPEGLAPGVPGPGQTFITFVSAEMGTGGKLVKGAPYSAEAVTETTQTLSDGNRITRKNSAHIYRDSEGRTRREQTFNAIGPWSMAGDPPQTISIHDPVAGVHYLLDAKTRTAHKLSLPPGVQEAPKRMEASRSATGDVVFFGNQAIGPENGAGMRFERRIPADNATTESLGKKVIQGVEAEGSRSTVTIPAGEIGNERPIQIVDERWYSPELQTVMLTRHTDPRLGETVYQLTNLSRSEPVRSLFTLPADYTITDEPLRARPFTKKKPE